MRKQLASHHDYSRWLLCLVSLVSVLSCTTGGRLMSDPQMRSLESLHQAARFALTDAIGSQSQNTRTYRSHYHIPGTDLNARPKAGQKRGQVIIQILGDRRPYTVAVSYPVEVVKNGTYVLSHYDDKLARRVLDRMLDYLASRPGERDVIDDFRPY